MAINSHLKRTQSYMSDSQTLIDSQTPCKKPRSSPVRLVGNATIIPAEELVDVGRDRALPLAFKDTTPIDNNDAGNIVTKDAHNPPPLCVLTRSAQVIRETYMIPKDIPAELMNDLEQAWGLAPYTFDFDSLDNTLNLTQELCEGFENGQWALVPTDKALLARLERFAYREGDNAEIKTVFDVYKAEGKTTFTFSFVPFPDFEVDIGRFEDGASSLSDCPSQTIHQYPYEEFPALTLPLYPHLALANFMRKYTSLGKSEKSDLRMWMTTNSRLCCAVMSCEWIWKRWAPLREYPHLPPVDQALDALIIPSDSTSCRGGKVPSIVESGVENVKDDDNDEIEWQEPRWRFVMRLNLWLRAMQDFKDKSPQNRQDFCSPKYTELPPTRPSSPIFFSFDHPFAKSAEDE